MFAMTLRHSLLLLALVAVSAAADTPPAMVTPLTTVASVDLGRYVGTWYEIAKFPNRFQKQCIGFTQADYRVRPDAAIEVVNRCRLADGKTEQVVGAARQLGGPTSATLEVRFAPAWLSFVPAVWGDYWIIDLDPAYQLVAVSEPKREYLWILARTNIVAPGAYQALLGRLEQKGFDLRKLVVTPQ